MNVRRLICGAVMVLGVFAVILICEARTKPPATPLPVPPVAKFLLTNEFFAFDNGINRGRPTIEQQAKTLKEIGYAGIGYSGTADMAKKVKAFKDQGIKVFSTYVWCRPGTKTPYDPKLIDVMTAFEGTGAMLWLTVQGKTDDEKTVAVVRELADKAAKHGVKIALYPHYGFYVATAEQAIRVVKKVKRKNVGVSINLCHELRAGTGPKLPEIIKSAAPYLFLVSINGADHKGGWDKLIRPLGDGEFDVLGFLKQILAVHYHGPIGLQCYAVKGDQKKNLARSLATWKKYQRAIAGEEK